MPTLNLVNSPDERYSMTEYTAGKPSAMARSFSEEAQARLVADPSWKGYRKADLLAQADALEAIGDIPAAAWRRHIASISR